MKIYHGNDICEIDRIGQVFEKYKEKFLAKTFTKSEIKYCISSHKLAVQRLAVRFAVKEAVSKALGVGINRLGWNKGINWKDVEVVRETEGGVKVRLYNKAKKLEEDLGITEWAVSVSHSRTDALATVVGYSALSS